MKKNILSVLSLVLVLTVVLIGCGDSDALSAPIKKTIKSSNSTTLPNNSENKSKDSLAETELVVRFGDKGEPFTMYLYDNDTAATIAKHVGTSDWRLPIYHYDDYDNWEVMQYYDIPSRYEIPSKPEQITKEKAGTVYYSEPNRIILFYNDAELTREYTPVGYFEYTDEFLKAVQDNPVLEGWGNKIVQISDDK